MNTFEYNPISEIPFEGFCSSPDSQPDQYQSLMHWILSEKYRGVDESLRRYLLTISDLEILQMEANGINSQYLRPDWHRVQSKVIECGLWFQMLSNPGLMEELVSAEELACPDEDVTQEIISFYNCLTSDESYMRVAILGPEDFDDRDFVHESFSHIFASVTPKIIYTFGGAGASWIAESWGQDQYIPVRRVTGSTDNELALSIAQFATHAIDYSRQTNRSPLVAATLEAFDQQSKPARRIFRV